MVKSVLDDGMIRREAARIYRVDPKTVGRWATRFQEDGTTGLQDRSSRPRIQPHATPKHITRRICRKRRKNRLRMDQIARQESVSRATVSLYPKPPVQRYEHPHPGSMIHLEVKKLARFKIPGHRVTGVRHEDSRGSGWEYAHVAIDDHSRVGQIQIWPARLP